MVKNIVRYVFHAKVISKHRITIPEITRELADIEEGDIVKIEITEVNKKEEEP